MKSSFWEFVYFPAMSFFSTKSLYCRPIYAKIIYFVRKVRSFVPRNEARECFLMSCC